MIHVFLADDDATDCLLFKEALEELPIATSLTIVENGEKLIEELLKEGNELPDVLFLDLNMPRKNGFASLGLIKRNTFLQNLPVIIYSTASDVETVKKVYRDAAHYYITKPAEFSQLKKMIYEALMLISQENHPLPLEKMFLITGDAVVIPD